MDNYKKSTFSTKTIRPLGPVHLDWISDKLDYLSWLLGHFFCFFNIGQATSNLGKWNWNLFGGFLSLIFILGQCVYYRYCLECSIAPFPIWKRQEKNIDPLGRIKIRFNSICIKSIVPGKVYCFSDRGMQQLFFPMCFSLSGKKK